MTVEKTRHCFTHTKYKNADIVKVKLIDNLCQQHFFNFEKLKISIIDMSRDSGSEPRTRMASKPFEGTELPSDKKSTQRNASKNPKTMVSRSKNSKKSTNSRATIKKTTISTMKTRKKQTEDK